MFALNFTNEVNFMAQLWKGRFKKELAKETNDFNSSIKFDSRMFEEDIKGSIAHATMLGATGIIDKSESDKIVDGLNGILDDIKSGKLDIDMNAEDIHTFVEGELTARLGQTGKRLHTARSRNDQVALDIRMVLKKEIDEISEKINLYTDRTDLTVIDIEQFLLHLSVLSKMQKKDNAEIEKKRKELEKIILEEEKKKALAVEINNKFDTLDTEKLRLEQLLQSKPHYDEMLKKAENDEKILHSVKPKYDSFAESRKRYDSTLKNCKNAEINRKSAEENLKLKQNVFAEKKSLEGKIATLNEESGKLRAKEDTYRKYFNLTANLNVYESVLQNSEKEISDNRKSYSDTENLKTNAEKFISEQ